MYGAFGNVVSRSGSTPTPFGFAGAHQYQTDGDSGLQLLGNRYYDPSTGRFISSDSAKAGRNWYAYCGNNPLSKVDPLGYKSYSLGIGIVGMLGWGGGDASISIGRDDNGKLGIQIGIHYGLGLGGGASGGLQGSVSPGNIKSGWANEFIQEAYVAFWGGGSGSIVEYPDDNGNITTGAGGSWKLGGGGGTGIMTGVGGSWTIDIGNVSDLPRQPNDPGNIGYPVNPHDRRGNYIYD